MCAANRHRVCSGSVETVRAAKAPHTRARAHTHTTGGGGPVHHSIGLCGYDYVLDVDDDDVVLASKVGAVVVGGVAVDEPAPVHPHKDGQRAVRCEAVRHRHRHTHTHTHTYRTNVVLF